MKGRFKNLLFGIITLIGTFIFIYFIGEMIVYFSYGKEMALFPRYVTGVHYNDYFIRSNIPNSVYWHKSFDGRWKFKINAQGFRSPVDYSYQKPEGTLRVLVLGDSFTVGYEVAQGETYAAVLERELRQQGIVAEVINAGVSGFSNAEELVFLEQEGIRYQPDVVVLGFYANDLSDNVRTGLFQISQEKLVVRSKHYAPVTGIRDFLNSFHLYRWLSENSYLHNYLNAAATLSVKGWLHQKREKEIENIQGGGPLNLEKYQKQLACRLMEKMHQVASRHQALFILLEIPAYRHNQVFPSWPMETCAPKSVSNIYVDGSYMLEKLAPGKEWYRPHGHRHWTPMSHEAAGKYLAELIVKHPKIRHASFAQKSQK